jgi:hypothetical protein
MKTSTIFAIAALTVSFPAGAIAQFYDPLTPAECQTAATALANRAPSAQWDRLGTCGAVGAQAFKTALAAARLTSDVTFLSVLASQAGFVRDVGLLQTAMELAEDNGATTAARVAGLLTALSQYQAALRIRERTFSQLVSTPLGSFCFVSASIGVPYMSDLGVTLADRQAASDRSAALALSSSNAVVRDLARCVSDYVSFDAPPSVDPQLITIAYVCGTKHRVRNAGTRQVLVSYQLFHGPEHGEFYVPPGGEELIITHCECGLELSYKGLAIRQSFWTGTPC